MDVVSSMRRKFRRFFARPQDHELRVKNVQSQVREWKKSGSQQTMRSKRSPWLTMSVALRSKDNNHLIDCSELRDILSIDEEKMVVRVEPMVDMGTLSAELLPRGLAMAVHIEMEDITVGGLCAGMGMETNSHRVGMIHENVISIDVVVGDGSVVHATRTNEFADLFTCIPWSHGSLGLLVAAELKLVRIQPFVHVEYICCYSKDSYISKMQELSSSENAPEFLECTVFSRDTAVIQCGRMANVVTKEEQAKVNPVNSFWKTWYYVWMESFLERKLMKYDEYIPAKHYFHRFSRSIFWELRDMIPFANHPIYRYLLGWMGAPKVKIIKLLTNRKIRWETMYKHVVQDLIVPITDAGELIDKCDEWFGIYPLLFFPLRMLDHGPHQGLLRNPQNPEKKFEMFFDLGIYGIPKLVREKKPWDAKATLRQMEAWVRSRRGYQALYCDIFQVSAPALCLCRCWPVSLTTRCRPGRSCAACSTTLCTIKCA